MRPFTTTWDMLLWWLQLEFCAGLVTIWVIIFLSLSIFFWNIILYFFIAAVVIVICLSISSFCHIQFFQIVKRHKIQIQAQQQALQNADNNLNIMRLKKSSMKTFAFYIVMILCYFPMLLNLVLMATNAKDEDDQILEPVYFDCISELFHKSNFVLMASEWPSFGNC